jgi:TonB-linked SusC/RagA family outer membrane protein
MKQKFYTLFIGLALLFIGTTALAQSVSGTVKSEDDGLGIPGVSVVVKGTSRATLTDVDGNFTLNAPPESILVFSLVGYKMQEITVGNQTVIDVTMAGGNINMDEVVVTALGTPTEKRKNGFASQKVEGSDLAGTNRDNFLESLQGRIAGLNVTSTGGTPGASALIVLRNATSFSQDNQPLFVIDGVPINNTTFSQGALVSDGPNRNQDYSNPAADINPNDIESINVLKGAEAAALYGFYGANGAIIITTKKGRSGPGKLTYSNSFGFSELYRFPEIQTTYQRGANGLNDLLYRRHFGSKYPAGTQLYDNIGNFFETGSTASHNLGFEGGNDRTTYRISGAYSDNKGVVPTTRLSRYNFRVSGSTKISDQLEVSSALNFVKSDNVKTARGINGLFLNILAFPQDVDASVYLNPNGSRIKLSNVNLAAGAPAAETDFDNPFFDVSKNKARDITDRTYGNFNLSYNPIKWLNLTGNVGYDIGTTEGNFFIHPESNRGIGSRGEVENYVRNARVLNSTLYAKATKDFGKLNASLRIGGSGDEQRYNTLALRGQRLIVPELNSLNNSDITTQRTKQTYSLRRSVSAFADVSLDYDRFLTFNASIRNDRTSTLNAPNNSFVYPGANISFVFSELLKIKNFDFGKLRFGLAGSGRDVPPYNIKSDLAPQLTTGGGYALGFTGNSPDLKPEIISSYSAGLELNFFKSRIGLDVTYYDQVNDNQIMRLVRLSYATGYVLQNFNGGKLSSSGIEAILTLVPVRNKNFEWSTLFNFASSQTKVVAFPKDVPEFYVADTWLYANARASIFPDGNATTIGGYTYARNKNGEVLVSGTSGLPIIDQNFKKIGDRQPDFNLGIINKFKYKDISVSFALDIRKGGDIYNGNALYLSVFGLHPNQNNREEPIIVKGVLSDGKQDSDNPTKNTIQVVPYTNNEYYRTSFAEENFIEKDINWLRLKDFRVAYNIPQSALKKIHAFKTLSVFVSGTDLFLITNYSGADPNVNGVTPGAGGAGGGGFDYGTLSTPRVINFGLNVGF